MLAANVVSIGVGLILRELNGKRTREALRLIDRRPLRATALIYRGGNTKGSPLVRLKASNSRISRLYSSRSVTRLSVSAIAADYLVGVSGAIIAELVKVFKVFKVFKVLKG